MKKSEFTEAMGRLQDMELDQLKSIKVEVEDLISQRQRATEVKLTELARATFAKSGLNFDEMFGVKSRAKAAAKYRNPNNPNETWTGQGRKPNWLAAAIENGRKIEEFAISPSAPATRPSAMAE